MALERGRRFSSVDRALDGWRKEATANRQKIARLERRLAMGVVMVYVALEGLDSQDPAKVRAALDDALRFMNTDERKTT